MPDTNRDLAALQAILADNTTADISPQDLRDAILSCFTLTTKGDIAGIDIAGLRQRLGVGTDGDVLTADAASTLGFKWDTVGAAAHPDLATHDALGLATDAELTAHTGDTSDAHDASAISVDSTTLVGTGVDVQAVLEELDNGIADHLADGTDAHAASAITNTPAGTVAATTVQAAIDELATDYAAADSTHAGDADPHSGYVLESLFDAKGDIIAASADNTPARRSVGANGTILMANSSVSMGLTWALPATPSTVGTANAAGSDDTFTRGDHVHAHEAAHINHDTTWAAKGDLIVGTANDTAAVLTVGANDTIPMADSGQATGIKWVASQTPSTQAFADAAAEGTADTYARGDHKHAMPANPVTAHEAAGDPHTGYRLESADHSHASTGLQGGIIDSDDIAYVPASTADWGGSDPGDVEQALDVLADRTSKQMIYIPGWQLIPSYDRAAWVTAPSVHTVTTNDFAYRALQFSGTAKQYSAGDFPLPANYDASTLTARFRWKSVDGSGTVIWGIQMLSVADDDAHDAAMGTAIEVTDTLTTIGDYQRSDSTAAITPSGTAAAADHIFFEVYRDGANDTHGGTVQLIGVEIYFTLTAAGVA